MNAKICSGVDFGFLFDKFVKYREIVGASKLAGLDRLVNIGARFNYFIPSSSDKFKMQLGVEFDIYPMGIISVIKGSSFSKIDDDLFKKFSDKIKKTTSPSDVQEINNYVNKIFSNSISQENQLSAYDKMNKIFELKFTFGLLFN